LGERPIRLAVPAWICKQCGEPALEASEVDSIQAILQAIDQQVERLARTA
jgi:hypothetical protein